MWQSPNQRVRAIANARKRERERLMQPFHFRRVEAEMQAEGGLAMPVRIILNDFSPKGMGLFSHQHLVSGQEVQIHLKAPRELSIKGRVIACQEYENDSHILSPKSYPYRIGIRFVFENPEQEKAIDDFCKELGHDYLYGSKAA